MVQLHEPQALLEAGVAAARQDLARAATSLARRAIGNDPLCRFDTSRHGDSDIRHLRQCRARVRELERSLRELRVTQ